MTEHEIEVTSPRNASRVAIRPFGRDDITENYLAWLNDDRLMRFSNQRFVKHTVETARNYLESFSETESEFVALLCRKSQELIGTATMHVDPIHGTADLGILIGREHAQQGFGLEGWVRLIEDCRQRSLRKVTAGTSEHNRRMIRIAEASGMKIEGRRVAQQVFDGKPSDLLEFGLLL